MKNKISYLFFWRLIGFWNKLKKDLIELNRKKFNFTWYDMISYASFFFYFYFFHIYNNSDIGLIIKKQFILYNYIYIYIYIIFY